MKSELQDAFLSELAETFQFTARRLTELLSNCKTSDEASNLVDEELRGLYHGLLVIFDGGTTLADKGLIEIVDEDGVAFDRFLHELCFDYWPAET